MHDVGYRYVKPAGGPPPQGAEPQEGQEAAAVAACSPAVVSDDDHRDNAQVDAFGGDWEEATSGATSGDVEDGDRPLTHRTVEPDNVLAPQPTKTFAELMAERRWKKWVATNSALPSSQSWASEAQPISGFILDGEAVVVAPKDLARHQVRTYLDSIERWSGPRVQRMRIKRGECVALTPLVEEARRRGYRVRWAPERVFEQSAWLLSRELD